LGQAAVELSGQLAGGAVELRISGREAELVYVEDAGAPPGGDLGEDQSARISLRLPEQLKARVEEAAAQEGVSTNAWIVRVLARGAWTGKTAPSRKRLTGYGWA
jgi:predicted HicB family RNase H-like nuclease